MREGGTEGNMHGRGKSVGRGKRGGLFMLYPTSVLNIKCFIFLNITKCRSELVPSSDFSSC